MTSYAAPTTYSGYAAPQMSYEPPMTDMQLKMIGHQYTTQVDMIKAECERNITMATNQFQQQRDQAILALDQQQKQQEMQLAMAKQQRVMAISQQAAQMQAQASQMQMQMDMQKKMASLYSGAGMGAGKTGATKGATDAKAATDKKATATKTK